MIVLDDSKEKLEQLWENVEYVGTSADNPYAWNVRLMSSSARDQKLARSASSGPRCEALALILQLQ